MKKIGQNLGDIAAYLGGTTFGPRDTDILNFIVRAVLAYEKYEPTLEALKDQERCLQEVFRVAKYMDPGIKNLLTDGLALVSAAVVKAETK